MPNTAILSNKNAHLSSLEPQVIHLTEPIGDFGIYEFKIEHKHATPLEINFRFISDDGYVSNDYLKTNIQNQILFYIIPETEDVGKTYQQIELEGDYDPFIKIALTIKPIPLS